MCSPKGAGFLYARKEVQPLLEPLVVSWGWEADEPGPSRFVDEQEWQGTRDIAAYLTVPAAIEFMAAHEWERVRVRCHELLRGLPGEAHLRGAPHLKRICPDSAEWYAQMAAFELPACDAGALKRRLYDEYRVEVPIIEWAPSGEGAGGLRQFVRVSVQGYNDEADIDALVSALAALLPQVGGKQ